ncbi:hypothetical protein EDB19DRAFT_1897521 [Suillus lakei]|nr:hypothetical protein EDB19DRAFT_1897521 [Suillus lakei]
MQEVLDYFDNVVYNDLPAHLIYIPEMRLINRVDIFDIHLNYAIFSHRWLREGEPTFADMQNPAAKTGPGFEKLAKFCEKARAYNCIFAWSDTCCIDKNSSAELDEAIRSMFKWYRDAFICIVHLATSSSLDDLYNDPWFTRGWTLQELLAPEEIKFYGEKWISLPTNLDDKGPDQDAYHQHTLRTIATKMSWAAMRRTTRIEDTAYSLMGIFDVSLTIAYGEGERAFFRLLQAVRHQPSRHADQGVASWVRFYSP